MLDCSFKWSADSAQRAGSERAAMHRNVWWSLSNSLLGNHSGRGGAQAAKPLQMARTALRVEDCSRGVVQVSHISHTDIRVLIQSVIGSALQHPLAL